MTDSPNGILTRCASLSLDSNSKAPILSATAIQKNTARDWPP